MTKRQKYILTTKLIKIMKKILSLSMMAAMVLAMLASSLSGTIIPILFKKLGVDPAVASGPLITTINDLVAVVAYYGLAWLLLVNTVG